MTKYVGALLTCSLILITLAFVISRTPSKAETQTPNATGPKKFYRYDVVAEAGQDGLTAFGPGPSINDLGTVAFMGSTSAPYQIGQGIFVRNISESAPRHLSNGFQSSTRVFSSTVQINNNNQVGARDRTSGAPPPSIVRVWDGSSAGGARTIAQAGFSINPYDSVFSPVSLNNQVDTSDASKIRNYVFGAIKHTSLDNVLVTPNEIPVTTSGISRNELPGTIQRPMISDDGQIVTRIGTTALGSAADPIRVFNNNLTPNRTIADAGSFAQAPGLPDFGQSPGISDDGVAVAFYADLSNPTTAGSMGTNTGPGIFIEIRDGAGPRRLIRVAGRFVNRDHPKDLCALGAACVNAELGFGSQGVALNFANSSGNGFDKDSRIAVIHSNSGIPNDLNGDSVVVSFIATPNGASVNNTFSSQRGLWSVQIDFTKVNGVLKYKISRPIPVLQNSDTIGSKVISSINVYDQLAKLGSTDDRPGSHRLALWASTTTGQLILRANQTAACKIPDLSDLEGVSLEWDDLVLSGQSVPIIPKPEGGSIDSARQCLLNATGNILQTTSWWRPVEYQRHFRQIKDKWFAPGNLKTNEEAYCSETKESVGKHREKHGIGTKVCNPDTAECAHPAGRAFDARIPNIPNFSSMVAQCNLYQRYPDDDGVHFELIPTPIINSLSPSSAPERSAGEGSNLNIEIKGRNFIKGSSKVLWNGQERAAVVFDQNVLRVTIPASDLGTAGTYPVRVVNPNAPAGTGTSSPKNFVVTASPASNHEESVTGIGSAGAPLIASPVIVKGVRIVVGDSVRYRYRVVNNSERSVTSFVVGMDSTGASLLEYPPTDWDVFTGTPVSSFTSPAEWDFDVLWDTETSLKSLSWGIREGGEGIGPKSGITGFSILVPATDPTYTSQFTVTLDDGTLITAPILITDWPFDYDADLVSDLSVFRPSNNRWYVNKQNNGFIDMEWGSSGDLLVPADYDGDGKTDIAVFRPSNATWYIIRSANNEIQTFVWGESGDVPAPADYDGDGRSDLAMFRPSSGQWFTRFANDTYAVTSFGAPGDMPVGGDFDGDGEMDIAVYRPSDNNWYILKSLTGYYVETWGETGDIPAPADYDGDGKADIAVFRPTSGEWYRINSSDGFDKVNWGMVGDVPIAADYDGDGRADVSVFRPSDSIWYVNGSLTGIRLQQFGQNGDKPIQAAYIR